ncbi:MAG: type II/IV secretion system protein [Burkholderiaceae bacterium]|nr:MAG: type II/IV secretion system protein [Burkholderiaceae bacterium]
MARKALGQTLVDDGLISEDQLRIALQEQARLQQPLGKILINLGFLTESTLRDSLSETLGQGTVDLSSIAVDAAALQMIPRDFARHYKIFPVALDAELGRLTIAMASAHDVVALDQLRLRLRSQFDREPTLVPLLAGETDLLDAIDRYYAYEFSIDGILREIETGTIELQPYALQGEDYGQPVVRLINALLADAARGGASDIHFEPEPAFLRIRYRIDGVLRQVRALHRSYWPAMLVRLKVVSGMNLAESRAPQDGRITLTISGREIDFRASTQPVTHGENFVARILDRQRGIFTLDGLGLQEHILSELKLMLARPEGLILVTGPTGSGKTTTLYSVLNHLNSEHINIMTLEDPVEYPLPMVRQTAVSDAAKTTFASGVRAILRQDPDVILIGEIRDQETAEMAFRAAMTGHQVFSTLHTNSAVGVLARLLDLGVLRDIMAGNLIGVIAQRLVRVLCTHCKKAEPADALECRLLGQSTEMAPEIFHPAGCKHCNFQGYKGRIALMEVLRITPELEQLIALKGTAQDLLHAALKQGFLPLAEEAARRVLDGTTALAEVSRTVDLTGRA